MSRKLDNWLEHYIDFTQNSEPPVLYHVWTGITVISSCLQRKCFIDWGYEQIIYPNLYVVLVGPPGGRKGTSMKMGKNFLQMVGVKMSSDSLGSVQALYNEIAESKATWISSDGLEKDHKSLSVWSEEFQVFLSNADPRLISNITDLFDSPAFWKYSSIGRGLDDLSNCWLTIFGAITPSLLQSSLSQDAVGGGLISRIIFVVGYGKSKKIPVAFFSKEDREKQELLYEDLEMIKNMQGNFRPTQKFIDVYSAWYLNPNSNAGVDNDKFVGYNERRALHLRKLCMIMSASESDSKVLHERHFNRALFVLEMTEQKMSDAFHGLGTAQHSNTMVNVMKYVEANQSVAWNVLTNRFMLDANSKDLEDIVETLRQAGRIVIDHDAKKHRYVTFNAMGQAKADHDYTKNELFKHLK